MSSETPTVRRQRAGGPPTPILVYHMKCLFDYSVTLLIVSLHSLLPASRQLVGWCFHAHSLGGMRRRRRVGSIPPSAVKMYLKQTSTSTRLMSRINCLICLLLSGEKRAREGELGLKHVAFLSVRLQDEPPPTAMSPH